MAYSLTDRDMAKDAAYMLMDNGDADATGTSFVTTQFSFTKFIHALDDRQRKFIRDTGCVQARGTIAGIAGQTRYTLPNDWIQTRRLAWKTIDNDISALERSDVWELDHGQSTWAQDAATPIVFNESDTPTLTTEIAPLPDDIGTLLLLYIQQPTTVNGSGIVMSIPDEFSSYVMFGALADLLGADGEGFDPQRASYCESRFEEGVELAKVMLRSVEVST